MDVTYMRERGDHRIVMVLFTVPSRPHRRCGWRVLRRRPRVWFAHRFNRLLGHPYCHCCFSDGEYVRSSTFGDVTYYAYERFKRHPALAAGVVLEAAPDSDPDSSPSRWSCVSDVRGQLERCGITTGRCLTPSGLWKELVENQHGQPVRLAPR